MQQRQPRLGDILDDYCPRERRVTNHAVVAMVGQDVKQTRCTTCDAEHEYKNARVPAQRKKKAGPGTPFEEVLAACPAAAPVAGLPRTPIPRAGGRTRASAISAASRAPTASPRLLRRRSWRSSAARAVSRRRGPVHQQLIRATLPRVGPDQARPIPEFWRERPRARARGGSSRTAAGRDTVRARAGVGVEAGRQTTSRARSVRAPRAEQDNSRRPARRTTIARTQHRVNARTAPSRRRKRAK
jgi:hypothetical protein